jgi:hypothetical protein
MGLPIPPYTRPGATFIGSDAATFLPREGQAPNRGVLHMTDVVASNVQAMARNHANPPHEWWDKRNPGAVWQTVPLHNNARALLSVPGMETNHRGHCYQLEINDRAVDGDTYTDRQLEDLARDVIVPISKLYGLPFVAYRQRGEQSATAYGPGSRTRMTRDQWLNATTPTGERWGWCLHQNVPGQSHWDGPLDMGRLMAIATELAQDEGDDDMLTVDLIRSGHTAKGAEEFARAALAELGFRPGAQGLQMEQAVIRAKRQWFPNSTDNDGVIRGPFWRRMIAELSGACPEAIIPVIPPADCTACEDELAKARGMVARQATMIAAARDALG